MISRLLILLTFASMGLFAQISHDNLQFVFVDPAGVCANTAPLRYNPLTGGLFACKTSTWVNIGTGGTSTGTVTSVSSGNLSPLFTSSVATATSTPAISFALSNAGAGTVYGNRTGSSAAPAFTATPVLGVPTTTTGTLSLAGATSGTAVITPQLATGSPTLTLPNTTGTLADGASSPLALSATTGNLTCPTCTTSSGSLTSNQLLKGAGSQGIQTADLSGDVTTSGSTATTLATVNSGPGDCGDATHVCAITTNGKGLTTAQTATAITYPSTVHVFGASFDGSGLALSAGKTTYRTIPYACTIQAWNITADTGTATLKIWRKTTGTAIPTVSDSINTSGVSLSSGTAVHSTTLSDFTSTAISANDILAFNLTAVASATQVSVDYQCQ